MKMGLMNWYKVKGRLQRDDCQREHYDWDHRDNADYRDAVVELAEAIRAAFPVRIEVAKINQCLQEKGEAVRAYYYRLYEVFNKHSGMTEPNVRGAEPDIWECHLGNWFMRGLRGEIAQGVKSSCIGWKDARLAELLKYAIHVEKQLEETREAEAKRAAEEEKQAAAEEKLAAVRREKARAKSDKQLKLAILNAISKIGEVSRNRDGYGGRNTSKDGGKTRRWRCWICKTNDHLFRDCTKCRLCKKEGHWGQDCPKNQRNQAD